VEEAVGLARSYKRLNLDSPRATTKAGRKVLEKMKAVSRELADYAGEANDELRHFLDFGGSRTVSETAGLLAAQIASALEQHIHEGDRVRIGEGGKPPGSLPHSTNRGLADELAKIWATNTDRGWSHNGPWGDFVTLVFGLAGVKSGSRDHARLAARRFRKCEMEPRASRQGE
jgi:hypothetical protein